MTKLTALGVRALNRFGPRIDRTLTAEGIKSAAIKRANADNFGPWQIDEPLDRLLESYRSEAHLTKLGWLTVKETLVSSLANLIEMQTERGNIPDIANQHLRAPVFVVGLPRTGTTLLHGLMTRDENNRAPASWEVMFPGSYRDNPVGRSRAQRRCGQRLAWANRLAPEFKRIHPIAPDLPQECIAITAHALRSIQFHTTHNVPSYQDWFEQYGQEKAIAFHHDFLQHLEYGQPGGRWVLKAPGHLFSLAALLDRYPDARIVQTHRDPLQVIASMASHATVLRKAFSDQIEPNDIAADWVSRWSAALNGFLEERDRRPPHQFFDVHYQDLEAQPLNVVESIYGFLGWEFGELTRQRMDDFLRANPKDKHGKHRYTLAEYGLGREKESQRFAAYTKRFSIPSASIA